jgi:hypothetical protein
MLSMATYNCYRYLRKLNICRNNLTRADGILNRAHLENLRLDLLVLPELAFTGKNKSLLLDGAVCYFAVNRRPQES